MDTVVTVCFFLLTFRANGYMGRDFGHDNMGKKDSLFILNPFEQYGEKSVILLVFVAEVP